jgi:hypothetical protein
MISPATLEEILSLQFASEYMRSRHSPATLNREIGGGINDLRTLIDADIKQSDALRKVIAFALSNSGKNVPQIAENWVSLLRGRVEVFDYYSHVYGAFGSFLAGLFALVAVIAHSIGWLSYICALVSGLAAIWFGYKKFEFDRRKLWYKFVLCHLDSFKVQAGNGS